MSIVDLDQIGARNLIAQYVLECRKKGHFLPYDDYAIIDQWLARAPEPDRLLLILSDILPGYYEKAVDRSCPPSLKGVNKRILKKLDETSKRRTLASASRA